MADLDDLFGGDISSDGETEKNNLNTTVVPKTIVEDDQVTSLFGSDISSEDEQNEPQNVDDPGFRDRGLAIEDEQFGGLERATAKGPSEEIHHSHKMFHTNEHDEIMSLKLPAMVDVNMNEEFTSETYRKPNENTYLYTLPCDSIIRWRYTTDKQGNKVPETNAKIVIWEDGSKHFCIGKEYFVISEKPRKRDEFLLASVTPSVTQSVGRITKSMNCTPLLSKEGGHNVFMNRLKNKHVRRSKVLQATGQLESAHDWEDRVKEMKELEAKESREKDLMTQRISKSRRVGQGQFTTSWLEDGLDHGEDFATHEMDEGEATGRLMAAQQDLDESEDEEL